MALISWNWVHRRCTWAIHKGIWTQAGWANVLCVCFNKPPFPSKLACIPATPAQFPKDPPLRRSASGFRECLVLRLLGKLRYAGWPNFDGGIPVYQSPFGIIPLLNEPGLPRGASLKHLKPGWRYVARETQCVLPCTPVATKEERILFKRLLEELLAKGYSISTDAFFINCVSAGMRTNLFCQFGQNQKRERKSKLLYFPSMWVVKSGTTKHGESTKRRECSLQLPQVVLW